MRTYTPQSSAVALVNPIMRHDGAGWVCAARSPPNCQPGLGETPCAAQVGFEIGKACKSCPRGVLATKDYKVGAAPRPALAPPACCVLRPPAASPCCSRARGPGLPPPAASPVDPSAAVDAWHNQCVHCAAQEGDLIAKVPLNCSIKFTKQTGFASEYAQELLKNMHKDPTFNKTYALFLATQPGPNETFTPEVYTDAHLEMLQHPELVSAPGAVASPL